MKTSQSKHFVNCLPWFTPSFLTVQTLAVCWHCGQVPSDTPSPPPFLLFDVRALAPFVCRLRLVALLAVRVEYVFFRPLLFI
jgi:hypothetical protein